MNANSTLSLVTDQSTRRRVEAWQVTDRNIRTLVAWLRAADVRATSGAGWSGAPAVLLRLDDHGDHVAHIGDWVVLDRVAARKGRCLRTNDEAFSRRYRATRTARAAA